MLLCLICFVLKGLFDQTRNRTLTFFEMSCCENTCYRHLLWWRTCCCLWEAEEGNTAAVTDVIVCCSMYSNKQEKSFLLSVYCEPLRQFIHVAEPAPGVLVFHHTDTPVVMRDDVPIYLLYWHNVWWNNSWYHKCMAAGYREERIMVVLLKL